jgi:hypothetical protein
MSVDAPAATWRPRLVHDLMFRVDGFGWHAPELRDGVGFRWSGPGRLAGLRLPFRSDAPGRGEVHILGLAGGGAGLLQLFLNGHPLTFGHRATGGMEVIEFAWRAAAVAGQEVAELWIAVPQTVAKSRPAPDALEGRRLGVAVSCVVLERDTLSGGAGAPPEGATDAADALPLLIGRRWLARHLAAEAEHVDVAPAEDGRELRMMLTGLRLGAATLPRLAWRMRLDGDGGLRAAWRPEDNLGLALAGTVTVAAPPGEPLDGLAGLPVFDQAAIAALLRDAAGHFGRFVARAAGASGLGAEPATLARWHAALAEARACAGRSLAMLAVTESDLFGLLARVPAGSLFAPLQPRPMAAA